MATYAAQAVPKTGLNPTMNAAAGGGDRVPPGSVLLVLNGSGAGMVATLVTLDTADGDLTVADRDCTSIAAAGRQIIKVPNYWPYVDPADSLVGVTWSATTSITFGVFSV